MQIQRLTPMIYTLRKEEERMEIKEINIRCEIQHKAV